MIKQAYSSRVTSRKECNVLDKNGKLPLITAPMYSVVNTENQHEFLNRNIQVCLPRTKEFRLSTDCFSSCSLADFRFYVLGEVDSITTKTIYDFIQKSETPVKICIDTANGNLIILHNAIKLAKEIYGDKLIIMSGNVSTVNAFMGLQNAGCDYIRVGIGGNINGCATTKNTLVGQENLAELITECFQVQVDSKIVADGISSYVKFCELTYGCYDNGYAAINKLLYSGADLIMVGSLFAQAMESAARKIEEPIDECKSITYVLYEGMSTKNSQKLYSDNVSKHSEGFVTKLKVKWSLDEWLNGSETDSDYLPGFINCLQSAMSYTDSLTLGEFVGK